MVILKARIKRARYSVWTGNLISEELRYL